MSYCQLTDIQNVLRADALIQLTDDDDAGNINTAVVTECIATGDALIDSYCSSKYVVPFVAPVQPIVRKLSEDLAIYNLYDRRGEDIPESVQLRNKNALKLLQDISKGLANLGAPSPSAIEDPEIGIDTSTGSRVFTNTNTPGIDPGKSSLGNY